jgi:hypothetical protein
VAHPTNISFVLAKSVESVDVLPSSMLVYDAKFSMPSFTNSWVKSTTFPAQQVFSSGRITYTNSDAGTPNGNIVYTYPKISNWKGPCIAVQATLSGVGTNTTYAGIGFGLPPFDAGSNGWRCVIAYNTASANFSLVEQLGTNSATVTAGTSVNTTDLASWKLMAIVHNNRVSGLFDRGNGWELAGTWIPNKLNFNTSTSVSNCFPVIMGNCKTYKSWNVTAFSCGYAGTLGVQNTMQITYEDGSPIYDQAGNYYLGGTAILPNDAATGNTRWDHSHNAIWKVNPSTYASELVGTLLLKRNNTNTSSDISGKILYDRSAGLWNMFFQNSSEFNGGIDAKVYLYSTANNILSGVSVVTNYALVSTPTNLPFWDMDAVKIETNWYASYAHRTNNTGASASFMALAIGGSITNYPTMVYDAATNFPSSEGSRFFKFNGTNYLSVSCKTPAQINIYTMNGGLLGNIIPPEWPSSAFVPCSHGTIISMPNGNATRYLIDTFDQSLNMGAGGGTYGNRLIYESVLEYPGTDFAIYPAPPKR